MRLVPFAIDNREINTPATRLCMQFDREISSPDSKRKMVQADVESFTPNHLAATIGNCDVI